jgi:asparagine synthase (glutamine-hydrolysing)
VCGIAGVVDPTHRLSEETLQRTIVKMTDTLEHRGPDSHGTWIAPDKGVALGHRRLAIRELSPLGHQPMVSASGRYVLVYNGEIYSYADMAQELESAGVSFRGSSDTEVLLEACATWGVPKTLARLIGMFAFALFDQQDNVLWCARDRIGIKPFYWTMQNGVFLFGSEIKALCAYDGWHPALDRDAVASFTRFGYVPAPRTIYKDVYKLEPGHLLKLPLGGEPEIAPFWVAQDVVLQGLSERKAQPKREEELLEELEALLQEAVRCRLVADVPVGAFLSGGIDSSLIAALMVEQSATTVRTFSIGFADQEYNEAPYAASVARHLGTQHTELYAEAADALRLVEELPRWYDEPFSDSSQIPTMLVCALSREHVTVALSGDGGDELFAGYNRYQWAKHCRTLSHLPCASSLAHLLRSGACGQVCRLGTRAFPRFSPAQLPHKLRKVADVLELPEEEAIYRDIVSLWKRPELLVSRASEIQTLLWDKSLKEHIPDFCDRMQFLDLRTYLPDDILTKVDRASMRVALEARVPFLDHRVVECSWRLPFSMKLRHQTTKWALRALLYQRVPKALMDRPKMGFGIPLHAWLRGPLRSWADSLLDEKLLQQQGIFDPSLVRTTWTAHLDGRDEGYRLWNILTFQSWLQEHPHVSL